MPFCSLKIGISVVGVWVFFFFLLLLLLLVASAASLSVPHLFPLPYPLFPPLNQPLVTGSTPKVRRVLRCGELTRLLNPPNSLTLG